MIAQRQHVATVSQVPTQSRPLLQRKCACGGTAGPAGECESCREKRLAAERDARNQDQAIPALPPIVRDVVSESGQPLDAQTRGFMEPRFGHDFGHVRVHNDAKAADSARAVNALAYTVGRNVVFGANEFAPTTRQGCELLAHELAHTVQQRGATGEAPPVAEGSSLESGAQAAGRAAANGRAVAQPLGRSGVAVARAKASPEYYDDAELGREIAKYTEKLKTSSYPGRSGDADWLEQLKATQKQRASVKQVTAAPKKPPKPASWRLI